MGCRRVLEGEVVRLEVEIARTGGDCRAAGRTRLAHLFC